MSDACVRQYTTISDINKMSEQQQLDLSGISNGKRSIKKGSYFLFDQQKKLRWVAILQRGGGFITAEINGNQVNKRGGIKNETQVRDFLDSTEEGSYPIETTKQWNYPKTHLNPQKKVQKQTGTFKRYEIVRAQPPPDVPDVPDTSDETGTAEENDEEEELPPGGFHAGEGEERGSLKKRGRPLRPSVSLKKAHKQRAKRHHNKGEAQDEDEYISDRERPEKRGALSEAEAGGSEDEEAMVQKPRVKRLLMRDRVDEYTFDELQNLSESIADQMRSLRAMQEIRESAVPESVVQQALTGTVAVPSESEPGVPAPADVAVGSVEDTTASAAAPGPVVSSEVQERQEKEVQEAQALAAEESTRVGEKTGSETLADDVEKNAAADEEQKKAEKTAAAERARELEETINAAEGATVSEHQDKKIKADKLSQQQATGIPAETPTVKTHEKADETEEDFQKEGGNAEDNEVNPVAIELGDKDNNGNELMSSELSGTNQNPIDEDAGEPGNDVGANAAAKRDVVRQKDAEMERVDEQRKKEEFKAKQKAEKAAIKLAAKEKKAEAKKAAKEKRKADRTAQIEQNERHKALMAKPDSEMDEAEKKEWEEMLAKYPDGVPFPGAEKEDESIEMIQKDLDVHTVKQGFIDDLMNVLRDIPALREVDTTDAEHESNLQKRAQRAANAQMRLMAKGMNIQRLEAPSKEEIVDIAAREVLRDRFKAGAEGDFAIWTSQTSIAEVGKMQKIVSTKVADMTQEEARDIRGRMKPWWDEFSNILTTRGFEKMERMPTRLIEDPLGDIQLGQKFDPDMTQTELRFLDFMYWAMRSKTELNAMNGRVYWNELLTFSAAMGYNDLSEARINWLITGNWNGDMSGVDFEGMDLLEDEDVQGLGGQTPRIRPMEDVNGGHLTIVSKMITFTPNASQPAPGKNISPSAETAAIKREYRIVDGKVVLVADRTKNLAEQAQASIEGIPSAVSNIADPRFSERGGKSVENVRIVTRRNPNFHPAKPENGPKFITRHEPETGKGKGKKKKGGDDDDDDDDDDNENEFEDVKVADVGAGAHEIGAEIDKAEADRLTASLPFKLYAPIHPQACDRYLGERNYARLGLEAEKYFKSYTQQPFGVTDIQQQYNWNGFVINLYGGMLYAFVTDFNMQPTSPVFGVENGKAVTMEFMELNELISELERYQKKSADRSSRVGDSAVAQEPLEKHLSDFFEGRDEEEKEKMSDANIAMIALPDQGDDPDRKKKDPDDPKPDRPGQTGGGGKGGAVFADDPNNPPTLYRPNKRVRFGADTSSQTLGFGDDEKASRDIEQGVRSGITIKKPRVEVDPKIEMRSMHFRRFNR